MSNGDNFQIQINKAAELLRNGNFEAAERELVALVEMSADPEQSLNALLEFYMQNQRPLEAMNTLKKLHAEKPDSLFYLDRLAGMLTGFGQLGIAISYYQDFVGRHAGNADAWFNLALLYKRGKRFSDALEAYEKSLTLGVRGAEEVYSNLGVLYSEMRQADKAHSMYEQALQIDPQYIPALFNLAGLSEERGDRATAARLYEKILTLDSQHLESLSRLAYMKKIGEEDKDLLDKLETASNRDTADPIGKESIFFALGKSYDDLAQYDRAVEAYTKGNELGSARNPPYVTADVETGFHNLKKVFSKNRIRDADGDPSVSPIFICGMFRSGSTLIEQILSAHNSIIAAGELDFLQWLVTQNFTPYPDRVATSTAEELHAVGYQYLSLLESLFPKAWNITDKQPDNFLFLGLIKMLYPSARIIYTKRNPLDNCLSVFFQQLGGNLHYATRMENIAHYYQQHLVLMEHWHECFADNIFTVDYENLVNEPEPLLSGLLDFLELEWDPACLNFSESANPVKTASVWQVREGLHQNSCGRWKNYRDMIEDISQLLR
ncbi:MAG: tetratricopeptide repeat protein [Gammaproteobacteria bacterium]|nr:tetratricopeptide repeat protein [Gammaproteobacteria bacterium]